MIKKRKNKKVWGCKERWSSDRLYIYLRLREDRLRKKAIWAKSRMWWLG